MSAVEKIEIEYYDGEENVFDVPKKQWDSWSSLQRTVFNDLYSAMVWSPRFYQHVDADEVPDDHWEITAWNAAWEAAVAVGSPRTNFFKQVKQDER